MRRRFSSMAAWLLAAPASEPSDWLHRMLQFLEHNLVILPAGIIGGIVAVIFPPMFTVLGICFLLGLHRSKAVSGKPRIIQIATYVLLSLGSFLGLSRLNTMVQNKLADSNISFARLVASFSSKNNYIPPTFSPQVLPQTPVPVLLPKGVTDAPIERKAKRKTQTPSSAAPDRAPAKGEIILLVSLVNPANPAIVVENQSDTVANGILWELVMFRTSDKKMYSYATQSLGYLKAGTKSSLYTMGLNTLPHSAGTEQLVPGETFVGTLMVDCPLCKGVSLVVSFVWGSSGWFYEVPNQHGNLILPRGMSTEAVSRYIQQLTTTEIEKRIPIL